MFSKTVKLVFSALCLALCLLLPFLTAQLPSLGGMLLPMHIPVLLCGFLCGPLWGSIMGAIAPLLRSLLFSAPPMIPTALCMAVELAAYGAFSGLFGKLFGDKGIFGIYLSLIITMLLGRVVWGLFSFCFYRFLLGQSFTLPMFFAKAFLEAWPGMLLQVILIPPILISLRKTRLHLPEVRK